MLGRLRPLRPERDPGWTAWCVQSGCRDIALVCRCGYFFLPLPAFATALDTALSFVEGAAAVLFTTSFFGFFCSRPPFAICRPATDLARDRPYVRRHCHGKLAAWVGGR